MKPCNNCPFIGRFKGLNRDRAIEIVDCLKSDGHFYCHETVDYSSEEEASVTNGAKICIGSALFLDRVLPGGRFANSAYRMAEVFGIIRNLEAEEGTQVWATVEEFIEGVSQCP